MNQAPMSELIQQLIQRTGLNEQQARQVEQFLRENASKLPDWLRANPLADTVKLKFNK